MSSIVQSLSKVASPDFYKGLMQKSYEYYHPLLRQGRCVGGVLGF